MRCNSTVAKMLQRRACTATEVGEPEATLRSAGHRVLLQQAVLCSDEAICYVYSIYWTVRLLCFGSRRKEDTGRAYYFAMRLKSGRVTWGVRP